jgi:outer membrane lipoprotein SlyB
MKASHVMPWISPYRNWKRETLNMATAAGTGMFIGSLIGGRKGATVGAVTGSVARWVRWWTTR